MAGAWSIRRQNFRNPVLNPRHHSIDITMKTTRFGLLGIILLASLALALGQEAPTQPQLGDVSDTLHPLTRLENNPPDGVYRAIELGPHHRLWQKISLVQDENGFLQSSTNAYQEIGTGLHAWSETAQKWIPA